jgi:uncharacterized protein (TIGR03435 family)
MTERVASKLDGGRFLLLAVAMSIATPVARCQANAAQSGTAQGGSGQSGAEAQVENASAKLPAYDVVSIKLNKSGSGSVDTESNLTRYAATNIPLKKLLANAYDIREELISGVTGPMDSVRFDIAAKIVEPDYDALKKLSPKQRRAMLLPFLAERFQLKAHTETKTLPLYELIVVKDGPKFKQSASDSKQGGGTSVHNNRELTAHDVAMTSFASTLEGQVHRTVIDKTGLAGSYDLALKWSPDSGSDAQIDSAPSIFTALQEQLGLKLQAGKGPVETLVVDHVEMPSEN